MSDRDLVGKKVLLVEDEELIRNLYKRQLDLVGFITDAFPNGKDALEATKVNDYAIILLDIMLPEMNGLQVLKALKENEKTKNIPVVMLTNLGRDDTINQGFELGADGYLIKATLVPDQVVAEVQGILKSKQG